MIAQSKIIVLYDDPTGSQTVHSCLLLTRWDVDTLKIGLVVLFPGNVEDADALATVDQRLSK